MLVRVQQASHTWVFQVRLGSAASAWTLATTILLNTRGYVGKVRINANEGSSGAELVLNGGITLHTGSVAAEVVSLEIVGLEQLTGELTYAPAAGADSDKIGLVLLNGMEAHGNQPTNICSGYGVIIAENCQCWTNSAPICADSVAGSIYPSPRVVTTPRGSDGTEPNEAADDSASNGNGVTGTVLDAVPVFALYTIGGTLCLLLIICVLRCCRARRRAIETQRSSKTIDEALNEHHMLSRATHPHLSWDDVQRSTGESSGRKGSFLKTPAAWSNESDAARSRTSVSGPASFGLAPIVPARPSLGRPESREEGGEVLYSADGNIDPLTPAIGDVTRGPQLPSQKKRRKRSIRYPARLAERQISLDSVDETDESICDDKGTAERPDELDSKGHQRSPITVRKSAAGGEPSRLQFVESSLDDDIPCAEAAESYTHAFDAPFEEEPELTVVVRTPLSPSSRESPTIDTLQRKSRSQQQSTRHRTSESSMRTAGPPVDMARHPSMKHAHSSAKSPPQTPQPQPVNDATRQPSLTYFPTGRAAALSPTRPPPIALARHPSLKHAPPPLRKAVIDQERRIAQEMDELYGDDNSNLYAVPVEILNRPPNHTRKERRRSAQKTRRKEASKSAGMSMLATVSDSGEEHGEVDTSPRAAPRRETEWEVFARKSGNDLTLGTTEENPYLLPTSAREASRMSSINTTDCTEADESGNNIFSAFTAAMGEEPASELPAVNRPLRIETDLAMRNFGDVVAELDSDEEEDAMSEISESSTATASSVVRHTVRRDSLLTRDVTL